MLPFQNFLAVLPPPLYMMLKSGKKIWKHAYNIVCGVGGGIGHVQIEKKKAPQMQKCPKTFVHDLRYFGLTKQSYTQHSCKAGQLGQN